MTLGKGKILFDNDFTEIYDSVVWGSASLVALLGGGIGFTSVNEGSFASTVDESGGILAITSDTGDNDNAALIAGKFSPSNGTLSMEARFKYNNLDTSIYVGWAETMALDTPVMPAEFATATMTFNPGGMIGFNYDVDGTTDDFRAVMGDGSANTGGTAAANGIRANANVSVDQWIEARVILYPDGSGECWLGDASVVDGQNHPKLRLIKKFAAGVTPTDLFYAVLMAENRSGNARVLEVDYMRGWATRDWAYN